jgi:hypothetical protein
MCPKHKLINKNELNTYNLNEIIVDNRCKWNYDLLSMNKPRIPKSAY